MQMLYDSDSFVVVHMLADADLGAAKDDAGNKTPLPPQLVRHGFEIVDKRSGTQEEVEDTLDGYVGLAQNPVVIH